MSTPTCNTLPARIPECKQRLSVAGVRETDVCGMDWEMVVDPEEPPVSASYEKLTRAYVGLDNLCGWHVEDSVSELQQLCQAGDMQAVAAKIYADRGTLTPGLIGLETGYNVLHFAVKYDAAQLIEMLTCTCICFVGTWACSFDLLVFSRATLSAHFHHECDFAILFYFLCV